MKIGRSTGIVGVGRGEIGLANGFRFQQFELDLDTRSLRGPEGEIPLRPQALAVLELLLQRAPAIVSRTELLDGVWGHQSTSTSSVPQTIRELRAALGDSSRQPHLIATRHRLGYQFIGPIERLDERAQPPEGDATPGAEARRKPRSTLLVLAAAALAAVAVCIPLIQRSATPMDGSVPMPVVIDLNERPRDTDNAAWFGPGIELFVGHALAQLGVQVAGRWSTNEALDIGQAGRIQLDWDLRPDGSVSVTARTLAPDTGRLFAETRVEHPELDIAAVAIELARAIGHDLGVPGSSLIDPASIQALLPRSPAEHQAYLDARELLAQGRAYSAIARMDRFEDPSLRSPLLVHMAAQAHALQGNYELARAEIQSALDATRLWPRRDRLSIEATAALLDFNPELAADLLQSLNEFYPDPLSVQRMIDAQIDAGRVDAASRTLDSLSAMRPDAPHVHRLFARLEERRNNPARQREHAIETIRTASEAGQDAVALGGLILLANAERKLGQVEAAADALQRAEDYETTPDLLPALGRIALLQADLMFQQGDLAGANAALDRAETFFDTLQSEVGRAEAGIQRGIVLERSGRPEESVAELETAIDRLRRIGDSATLARAHVNLGITLARQGRADDAISRLEDAGRFYRIRGDRLGEAAALGNLGSLLRTILPMGVYTSSGFS